MLDNKLKNRVKKSANFLFFALNVLIDKGVDYTIVVVIIVVVIDIVNKLEIVVAIRIPNRYILIES